MRRIFTQIKPRKKIFNHTLTNQHRAATLLPRIKVIDKPFKTRLIA